MIEKWHDEPWAKDMWWSGKTTRRIFLGLSRDRGRRAGRHDAGARALAGGIRSGQAVQDRRPAAAHRGGGGRRQDGARRHPAGGRAGSTSRAGSTAGPSSSWSPTTSRSRTSGRRKAEKLLIEDKVDVGEGGYLSNVCMACMPVFEEHKTVYMIGVCLDTTITTSKCSRYVFRPFDYAPAQAVAISPYLVKQHGQEVAHRLPRLRVGPIDHATRTSSRSRRVGGEIAGTTGIPLGVAADMSRRSSRRSPAASRASSPSCSGPTP